MVPTRIARPLVLTDLIANRAGDPRSGILSRLLTAVCGLGLLVAGTAQAQVGTIRFDNWLYYQSNIGGSERWQYRPRVFVPYSLSGGWTTTSRVDLPVLYTDRVGRGEPQRELGGRDR